MTESEVGVFTTMAGRGNPFDYLTPNRMKILFLLNMEDDLIKISERINTPISEIKSELTLLKSINLVHDYKDGLLKPSCFIASFEEDKVGYSYAQKLGRVLAELLIQRWDEIINSITNLEIYNDLTHQELLFFFVGDKILDIGLLEALVEEEELFRSAPSRPTPKDPSAQYYFSMIQGRTEHLGKYGQEDLKLPWENWYYLSFGQNWIGNEYNERREKLKDKCNKLVDEGVRDPESLAEKLKLLKIGAEDNRVLISTAKAISMVLVKEYLERKTEIQNLYSSFKSSVYNPKGFYEFFSWFHHVVFACSIDYLVDKTFLQIPDSYFSSAIWYRENEEEGLVI